MSRGARTAFLLLFLVVFGGVWRQLIAQAPPTRPVHATPFNPASIPSQGAAGIGANAGVQVPALSTTTWTPIGPASLNEFGQAVSGRIAGVAADPTNANILYVASAGGGVWKTTNGGTSWVPLTDSQATAAMGCIGVAPSNGSVIYAGTGEANNSADSQYGDGILVSGDGGTTWTLETGPAGVFATSHLTCSKIAVDPTNANIAYAAMADVGNNSAFTPGTGVYKTTDGGATWANTTASIDSSNSWSEVVIDPNTPGTLYAAIGTFFQASTAGVYKSTNGGGTWTGPLANLPRFGTNSLTGRISIGISKANSNVIYVQAADVNSGGVLSIVRSDNGGTSSTPIPTPTNYMGGQGWYDQALVVDPLNAAIVYAIGGSGGVNVYRSANSGVTWTSMSGGALVPHVDHHAATFDANDLLVVGNDGGVYRLTNPATVTWADLNANLNTIQFTGIATHPTDPTIALGGSQDNGTEKMTGGNPVWNATDGGDGGNVRFSQQTPSVVYRMSPVESFGPTDFFRKSTDTGSTWTSAASGINGNDNMNFYAPFVVDPTNGNHVLFGSSKIYETSNGAGTWFPLNAVGFSGNPIDAIAVAPSDPVNTFYTANGGYFASTSQILVTTNHALTWVSRPLPVSGRVADIAVDPTASGTAYAVISTFSAGGHVFKTTNSGASWTSVSGNLPDMPTWAIRIDPANLSTLYVGNDTGVWQSVNGGGTWTRLGNGFPNVQVLDLDLNNNLRILAAGTHGRGMWELSIPVSLPPDLTIVKSHIGSFTQSQSGATYTITVTNSGGGSTTAAVSVSDTIPVGLTATAIGGPSWICTQPAGPCSNSTVLSPGTAEPPLAVTVNVAANAPASVTNTATVSGGGEINTANDTATDPTTVNPAGSGGGGTWTALTNPAPGGAGTMMQLTDGTVMALNGQNWMRLTPDAQGSYVNGSWTLNPIAPMSTPRLYFGSNVLPSGKVFVLGGEYSGPALVNNWSATGEIYDPVANTWTAIAPYPAQSGCPTPTSVGGNITAGSNVVTGLLNTTGFQAGWKLTGSGIPANTTIISVDSVSQIHISNNATATGASVLTFSFVTTGSITSGSSIITGILSTAGFQVGWGISGSGIPSSSTITSVDSVSQIHISQAATLTSTVSLTFAINFHQTSCFGDDPTTLLPNGKILAGGLLNKSTWLYDIASNTWSAGGTKVYDQSDEEGWAKQGDGRVIAYDIFKSISSGSGFAERYDPASNTWSSISPGDSTATGTLPVLSSGAVGDELGPELRLPDDRMFVIGANGHTGLFNPATNTWAAGPDITGTLGGSPYVFTADDAPAAMMPNGHVLLAADAGNGLQSSGTTTNGSNVITGIPTTAQLLVGWAVSGSGIPSGATITSIDSTTQVHISASATATATVSIKYGGIFSKPTQLLEFDPVANSMTPVSGGSGNLGSIPSFVTRMLVLPTGQVLFSDSTAQLWIFTPNGPPSPAWMPTVSQVVSNGGNSYTLTGTQINGQSAGSHYGDDVESDENYPIVRLVSGSNVFYARTTNWSYTGVGGGATPQTVDFTVPVAVPNGNYSLFVSGAGISSLAFPFTVGAAPVSDLTITKTHVGNFTQGQSGATYTITVTNSGAGSTSAAVSVSDTPPAGLTATNIAGTGWTCTQPAGPCSRSDVLAASASYPALTLTVNVAANAPASVTNTATVSGGGETNTSNDTATNPTTINALLPDLTISKTHVGNFTQSQIGATYTITVSNSGAGSTNAAVSVSDTPPAGLTATNIAGTGWTCTQPSGPCNRSDVLAASASYPALTLTVNVAANAPASVTNTATVSGGGETNTSNDTATNPTTINALLPDLTISKSHVGNFSQSQVGATYTITVTNSGAGSTSAAVSVSDTLPAGLTGTNIAGTGWTCTQPSGPCNRSDVLAASASYPTLTLTVNVAANAAASVTNTAAVSGGGETNTANDTANDVTTINCVGGGCGGTSTPFLTGFTNGTLRNDFGSFVGMRLTVGSSPVTVNSLGRICVAGNSGAHTVKVADANGVDLAGGSVSVNMAGCTAGQFTYAPLPGSITLLANTSYFLVSGETNGGDRWNDFAPVTPTSVAAINNSVWFNGSNYVAIGAANTSYVPPNFLYGSGPLPADLTITKTHVGNFTQGQTGATYAITVTNSGGAATSAAVSVSDVVPAGLTATSIAGTGWNCTQPAGPCNRSDVLAASASYPTLTLTANVAANAPSSLTNTATVSGGGETNTSNDTANDLTTINGTLPDLTITKTHVGNFSQSQIGAGYTITVTNSGVGPTTGLVSISDTMPAGLTATGIGGTGWTCTQPSGPCSRSDVLAASASYPTLTLSANVAANAPALVINAAAVSGGGESNSANDTATDPTTVTCVGGGCSSPIPFLTGFTNGTLRNDFGSFVGMRMTVGSSPITVNSLGRVCVSGNSATHTVKLADANGLDLAGGSVSVNMAGCTAGQFQYTALASNVTLLANTAYYLVSQETNGGDRWNDFAPVTPTNVATINNSVWFNGSSYVPIGAANTSYVPPNFLYGGAGGAQPPDLTITKTHVGNFTQGQNGVGYTITVSNSGGSATSAAVSVSDTVPAGLIATNITGSGWSCTQPAGPCNRSDVLAASASYPTLTLTVNVAANAPSSLTNTATVAGGGETNTANDTALDPTTIIGTLPDLTITKTHIGSFSQGQIGATYTITVTNSGAASTSAAVSVSDTAPAGLTATNIAGSGWSCTQPAGPCTRSDVLAASVSYPALTLTANVAANAASSVTNIATVSGGGESNTANDTASDPTTVNCVGGGCGGTPTPFLTGFAGGTLRNDFGSFVGMRFTVGASPITVNSLGRVCVAGNSGTHTVKFADANGVDLAGASVSVNLAGCTAGQFQYTALPSSVTLLANTSYFLVSQETNGGDRWNDFAPVTPTSVATINNSVWFNGSSYVAIGAANNSYVPPNFLYGGAGGPPPPDLTITKTHVGNFSQGQSGATYTITVTNSGGSATNATVSVSDTVPAGLTAASFAGSGWNCTQPAGPCTRSDVLAAGSSYPALTLTTNVAANAAANVTNTATVSGGGETNATNDTANDPTTVTCVGGGCATPNPFLTGFASTLLRNDFGSFIGMRFTAGSTPITVTSLGRICAAGNTGIHTIKLVDASSGLDVAGGSISLNMAGCTVGQFKYASLPSNVTLSANASYYLVSLETMNGDKWFEFGAVTSATAAAVNNSVWFNGSTFVTTGGANTSYVPPNFLYQ